MGGSISERCQQERLRSAREALDELLLGGLDLVGGDPVGDEGPAEATLEGDLCEGVDGDWLFDDPLLDEGPARKRASSEVIRLAEQACRDVELEQLVLHAALGLEDPADTVLQLALRARARGDQPRCSFDAEVDDDDDALDERTWEADQRERAVVEHVRASLEAWLLGEPDQRREQGGDVWRRR